MPDDITPITIRACLLEEAPLLLSFWKEAAAGESPTDNATGVNTLLKEREDAVMIAVDGDKIVGTIIAAFDGWRGNIYRLAILPEYRQRGIARKLVREAERRLVIRGAKRLVALASSHSDTSAPFWDAMASDGWHPSHPAARYAKTVQR
jgi:ribosomal protein S18 acetylase RimI-like enzyme